MLANFEPEVATERLQPAQDQELQFYRPQSMITDPREYGSLFEVLPDTVPEIVTALHGLLIHIFWASQYGLTLNREQQEQVQLRHVAKMLAQLQAIDDAPLNRSRPPERRLVGNCRDHSVLLCSILRQRGIPARARCGFGTYFRPDHYEDHWVSEYWDGNKGTWLMVDPQLDDLQQQVLQIGFDPLNMPPGQFVSGAEAWRLCRSGAADPDDFGIFDMKGLGFVRGNLIRDLAALNKMELLPWDCWGIMEKDFKVADNTLLDRVAEAVVGHDPELHVLYNENEGLRVPRVVRSYNGTLPQEIILDESR